MIVREPDQLTVGDTVVIHSTGIGSVDVVGEIVRETKTQLIVQHKQGGGVFNDRFMKKTRRMVGTGDSWHRVYITKPNDGEIERVRDNAERIQLARDIRQFNWRGADLKTLRAVKSILMEAKK